VLSGPGRKFDVVTVNTMRAFAQQGSGGGFSSTDLKTGISNTRETAGYCGRADFGQIGVGYFVVTFYAPFRKSTQETAKAGKRIS